MIVTPARKFAFHGEPLLSAHLTARIANVLQHLRHIAVQIRKTDYSANVGMLCAAMANPIALNYALSTVEDDAPSVSYATVYPVEMFLRVISAQVIMLLCL